MSPAHSNSYKKTIVVTHVHMGDSGAVHSRPAPAKPELTVSVLCSNATELQPQANNSGKSLAGPQHFLGCGIAEGDQCWQV